MPTILTARTPVTTTYNLTRLWWAYLLDWNWDYILDSEGERIIVIVAGGQLPITIYTARPVYTGLTWDDVSSSTWDSMASTVWDDLYSWTKPTFYTVRTPI